MSTKFFVYADGRWCEVDAASGRVSGWRETARFVYVRRGKLHVARSSAVLRGLRALAAGQHSSVRDGLALSIKRHVQVNVKKKKKEFRSSCQHSHCCCNNHRHIFKPNLSINKVPSVKIIPLELAGVKTVSTNTSSIADACIQVDDVNKPESVDTIAVTAKSGTGNRKLEIDNDESRISTKRAKINDENASKDGLKNQQKTNRREKKTSKTKIVTKESDLSEESNKIIPLTRSCLKNRLERDNKKQREKVFRELVIYEEDVLLFREFLAKNNTDVDLCRFDCDEEYKAKIFYTINPLVNVERCARIKQILDDNASSQDEKLTLKDFAVNLGLRSVNDVTKKNRYKTRNSVAGSQKKAETDDKNDNSTEGLQSDETDKENRRVSLRSANKNIREKLLNNIDDVFKNTSKKISNNAKDASEKDKENSKDIVEKPKRVGAKETASAADKSSSDSGKASLPSDKSADSKKSTRPRFKVPKRSSVAGGREYSNLEDHAIVAWVSLGGRPRLVKGNRLWRELQTEYYRLTGQSRSWHSLRNRYLRYILPALSSLALPPSHVARLRAAAAVGELKSRKKSAKSPSPPRLPAAPVGAWSRRPRHTPASPDDQPAVTEGGDLAKTVTSPSRVTRLQEAAARSAHSAGTQREPPSPTYAQVTRAFAARHASSPVPAPNAAPAPVAPARKTRRLYNPNARVL